MWDMRRPMKKDRPPMRSETHLRYLRSFKGRQSRLDSEMKSPQLRVDDARAYDDDRVPLAVVARGLGCTVLDLLGLAVSGGVKLFVAMRPYAWTLTVTLGDGLHRQAIGNTGVCQAEMLPKYAEELRDFGRATIKHIPVPGLPGMHFKTISEPQEVVIERVWIARQHVYSVSQ